MQSICKMRMLTYPITSSAYATLPDIDLKPFSFCNGVAEKERPYSYTSYSLILPI